MYKLSPKRRQSKLVSSAVAVMMLVAITLSGVAFASLQSQPATLKGNIIQTAVASLQVSPDGVNYANSMDGYVFGNLVPGGQPTPLNGYPVYVKNIGTTPLALKLSVSGPVANPNNVDLNKVHVFLIAGNGTSTQNLSLQDLINAHATGGIAVSQAEHVIPTVVMSYTIRIAMDADAVSGPGATLSNLDFNFSAVAVT